MHLTTFQLFWIQNAIPFRCEQHTFKKKNQIVLSHLKFRYWIDRKQHELNVKIHFPRQFIVPIDKSWVKKEKISCETVCHCILTLGGFVLLIFQCRFLASSFVLFCLQDTLCVPMIAKCSCGHFQLQTKKRVSLSLIYFVVVVVARIEQTRQTDAIYWFLCVARLQIFR